MCDVAQGKLTIFLAKECEPKLFSQMARVTDKICRIDEKKAQALSRGGNHQGFIAQIKDVELTSFNEIKKGSFLVDYAKRRDVSPVEGAKVNYVNYRTLTVVKE